LGIEFLGILTLKSYNYHQQLLILTTFDTIILPVSLKKYNHNMTKILAYSTLISLLVMIVSFTKRNTFDEELTLLNQLKTEPLQTKIEVPEFAATYNDEHFIVMPKYDYELNGLVVSYRLHDADGGMMLHALNKDHLNVADYCVVWGESANPALLNQFDFSNGQFTCQYSTQSQDAWQAFNNQQLSNNHLLALDDEVRETIGDITIGDQITIKGWLAHYKNPMGYERGTSTVRTDSGNGACETIFVNEISILQPMHGFWRQLLSFSFGAFLICLFLYVKAPYEPHK
jgi:hypothetical protein